ncbi:MAG TPA: hypothetical protein VGB90_09730 [Alphaproteobacteria bacterium]|jgi:hypothetical protein
MELAAGAISAVAAQFGGAAAAGAATAGLATAASGGLSLAGSILQGALSVGSALALSRAGAIRADAASASGILEAASIEDAAATEGLNLDLAAGDALTEIGVEGIQGLERRNSLKKMLLAQLGEQDTAVAAGGVDLSFGTPAEARKEAVRDTNRALQVDRSTEDFRGTRLRERAASLKLQARERRRGGLLRAASARFAAGAEADALRTEASARSLTEIGGTAFDILRRG